MKLLRLLIALCFVCSLVSCNDDDIVEASGRIELTDLIDDWTLINSTNPDYRECMDEAPVLSIRNSSIVFPVTAVADGCQIDSVELSYSFDGSNIMIEFGGVPLSYFIDFVDESNFSWRDDAFGFVESYERIP